MYDSTTLLFHSLWQFNNPLSRYVIYEGYYSVWLFSYLDPKHKLNVLVRNPCIRKTRLYKFVPPQTPLLDKKKTGVYRGKHYFLFAQQHRLWVVDRVPAIYVLRRYKKYIFHHKIFIFGEKFSMYLFSKWNEALYVDGCKNRLTDKGRELTRTVFEQKSEITAPPPTHTHTRTLTRFKVIPLLLCWPSIKVWRQSGALGKNWPTVA